MDLTGRTCQECGERLHGRSDKRFCDDGCRNAYHNRVTLDENKYVREVNAILRKNRRILARLIGDKDVVKIRESVFLSSGFSRAYCTHSLCTSKGKIYTFCYEYGYLPLEHDVVLLVRRKPESKGEA